MKPIADSELMLNDDGSIFHLHLQPEELAENVILVGDQDRVDIVAENFDTKEIVKHNREFSTINDTKNG
jgi:uridine phosphorylase